MKHGDLIGKLTLEEKAQLCTGLGRWHLKGQRTLGLPSLTVTDGPNGLHNLSRITSEATCMPSSSTIANSWDRSVAAASGDLIAVEALNAQISVVLGPGVNMKRSPLCGRNFEYFSEDPYLAGQLAACYINAVQARGVGTSLKHFAANNQERRRLSVDAVVDERTLREIYLPAFETAVRQAKPWTVMCAYNKLNGVYCSQNRWLLTKVLREEWGYEGVLMTDWDACDDRVLGLLAGQDLTMPSLTGEREKAVAQAVRDGKVPMEALDRTVDRMLELMLRGKANRNPNNHFSRKEHHKTARRLAAQCAVLLKNEETVLPLSQGESIALVGEMAKKPRFQGHGSAHVNPYEVDSAYEELLRSGAPFVYAQGYHGGGREDKALLEEAVHAARHTEKVVLFLGLTDDFEFEGKDRTHLRIPQNQIDLIYALADANPNLILALAGGSAVEMPWLEKAKALLLLGLGGEAVGSAAVDLLYGRVNPSGKLSETYPLTLEDTPAYHNFPGNPKTVEYREGIYIGYRYYDRMEKQVRFPFGHGLSYTSFRYSNIRLDKKSMRDDETLSVAFDVKNTGDRDGAEVAQVYVAPPESAIFRAPKELRGFEKVFLKAGERKTIRVQLEKRAFAYYHVGLGDWHVESGGYEILVGASSRDIRLKKSVEVISTQPEVPVPDYRESAPGYYTGNVQSVDTASFEAVLGRAVPPAVHPAGQPYDLSCTLEDMKNSRLLAVEHRKKQRYMERHPEADLSGAMETAFKHFFPGSLNYEMGRSLMDLYSGKQGSALKLVKNALGFVRWVPQLVRRNRL